MPKIYLIKSCISEVGGELVGNCGWCCHMLDFSQFPHGRWYSKPCSSLFEGLCLDYENRPRACIGSPFFDYDVSTYERNRFPVPWCCFRSHVLDFYKIPYELLDTASECIRKYAEEGLGDFERWALRYYKNQTVLWE